MTNRSLPVALDNLTRIHEWIGGRKPAFFLDVDGTLAPLAPRPELAEVPAETTDVLKTLSHDHLVCITSGRDLADLRQKVDVAGVAYTADHGYRILGPLGSGLELEVGPENGPGLELAAMELKRRLHTIDGVLVETKGRSLSVHYRTVAQENRPFVAEVVREVAESVQGFKLTAGKMVHELRPAIPWDKGRAMLWLLGQLRLGRRDTCPVCIGDDLTDEDMFVAARNWGVTVVVGRPERATEADYMLHECESTAMFLKTFISPVS
jgi:trehalose 6-phosphate phosphatase